jgi:tetratricopeptide (TPR) repeat protein
MRFQKFISVCLIVTLVIFLDLLTPTVANLATSVDSPITDDNLLKQISYNFLSLLTITFVAIFFLLLFLLIYWLVKNFNNKGTLVLPFESGTIKEANYSNAVAQLLVAELQRIPEIHRKFEEILRHHNELWDRKISCSSVYIFTKQENFNKEILIPLENIKAENANNNTVLDKMEVELAGITLPIVEILVLFKRLWPWRNTQQSIITGSLQKYGSKLIILAQMEFYENYDRPLKIFNWHLEESNDQDCNQLPQLVRNLAFKITYDLCKKSNKIAKHTENTETKDAKNWKSFQYFTEAIESYCQYQKHQQKEYLQATRDHCSKASKFEPGYENILALFCTLGIDLLQKTDYREAEEMFKCVLELNPNHLTASMGRVEVLARTDIYNRDLDDYVLESSDELGKIAQRGTIYRRKAEASRTWLGEIPERREEKEKALEEFERVLCKLKPLKSEDKFFRAFILARRGGIYGSRGDYEKSIQDLKESITIYQQLQKVYPDNIDWKNNYAWALGSLGVTYLLQEKYSEAIDRFCQSIGQYPKLDWVYASRGEVYRQQKKFDEALEEFNHALNLAREGNIDSSESGVRLNPGAALALASRGLTYFLRGDAGDNNNALNDFHEAVKLNPKMHWAWAKLSIINLQLGKYEIALDAIKKAIRITEQRDWYYYNQALIYKKQEQEVQAQGCLQIAIKKAEQYKVKFKDFKNLSTCQEYWRNDFNLALYHLVKGEKEATVKALYLQALNGSGKEPQASPRWINVAISDLHVFLCIFPDHQIAGSVQKFLQARLGGTAFS